MADPKLTHQTQEWKHGSPLISCRIDPQGKYAFAGSQDFSILRLEIGTDNKTLLNGHESWVRALNFLPDGQTLISGGFDERLIWWDCTAEKPEPKHTVDKAHDGWVRSVAVSPDGKLLATSGNDNLVKLWTADGQPVKTFAGHERHVYNVVFHPDGKQLASCDLMGKVKHWEIESGQESREMDATKLHKYDTTFRADIGGARSMTFSPDGKFLACGGITGVSNAFAGVGNVAVLLLDWETGKEVHLLQPDKAVRGTLWGLDWHPDNFLVGCCGGNGGQLFFWKPDNAKAFHQMKLPSDGRDLSLHPDGERLAVCHFDGGLRIFKMAAKEEPAKGEAEKKG